MTIRESIAKRVSPLKQRLRLETPVIDEVPMMAENLHTQAFELPGGLGGMIPVIIRGKAYGDVAGKWYRVSFSKTLGSPSVVAVGEARGGKIPSVAAPTINISAAEVASESIDIASVSVTVDIPTTKIPFINASFPALYSDIAWVQKQICDPVNTIRNSVVDMQSKLNDAIGRINEGLAKASQVAKDLNNAINDGLKKTRDNAQNALNDGLKKSRDNTQRALGDTISNVRDSVNNGLSQLIPNLYSAWGLPSTMIITPVHIRNVSSTGFEFQSFGKTTCYYIAIGNRS